MRLLGCLRVATDDDLKAAFMAKHGVTSCPPRKARAPEVKIKYRPDPTRLAIDPETAHDKKEKEAAFRDKAKIASEKYLKTENKIFRAKAKRDLIRAFKRRRKRKTGRAKEIKMLDDLAAPTKRQASQFKPRVTLAKAEDIAGPE